MKLYTASLKTDAGIDSYLIDCCKYRQLLVRLMQIWISSA